MANRTILDLRPTLRNDIGDLVTWRLMTGQGFERLVEFLFLNHHELQTNPPGPNELSFGPLPKMSRL